MQSISGTTETSTPDNFMGNIKRLSNSSSLLDEESEGDEVLPMTYIFLIDIVEFLRIIRTD